MDKKKVPNTSKEVRENPLGFLAKAIVQGPSKAIQQQEASGQDSLVESDTLPTDMTCSDGYDPKRVLESVGMKFLGPVEDDELFQYVEPPKGWKKVKTDHPLWSKLIDDRGRKRASIFYKAAFYDRSAYMIILRRFNLRLDYKREEKEGIVVVNVTDCGEKIYTTEPIPLPANEKKRRKAEKKAEKNARKWLNKHYPGWENPAAYWD